MALAEFQDYVFSPKASNILDDVVFIGTKEYFFRFPRKIEQHEYRKIVTTTFSFAGKPLDEAIADIIGIVKDVKELEAQLNAMAEENEEALAIKIEDLGRFRVEANWLGSGIHTNELDRKVGYKPFVQKLGKDKKKNIKAFYANHPKAAK